jgi:hypothetical protein
VDLLRGFLTNETDCGSKSAARVRERGSISGRGRRHRHIADCVLAKVCGKFGVAGAIFISAVSKYRYDASYAVEALVSLQYSGAIVALSRRPWSSYPRVLRVGWRASVYGVHDVVMDRPSRVHIPGFPNQTSLNVDTYVRHCKL